MKERKCDDGNLIQYCVQRREVISLFVNASHDCTKRERDLSNCVKPLRRKFVVPPPHTKVMADIFEVPRHVRPVSCPQSLVQRQQQQQQHQYSRFSRHLTICSASPELLFAFSLRRGGTFVCRNQQTLDSPLLALLDVLFVRVYYLRMNCCFTQMGVNEVHTYARTFRFGMHTSVLPSTCTAQHAV